MLYAVPAGPFGLARTLTLKSLSVGRHGRWIVPFSHRMFTGRALRLNGKSTQGSEMTTIQQAGMNGYRAREFEDMIESSPLHIIQWRENQGDHPAYRVLRILSSLPGGQKPVHFEHLRGFRTTIQHCRNYRLKTIFDINR